ncbi:MAG: hypothetical protein C0434_07730 [Xanthomonadaceae bacterium]|nr:hypothetical protein [Xanthomonadaceae bacterium]
MIALAMPLAALALLALLVPLVIHLIRRQVPREIAFAALDWLSARLPPRRQWRFDQRQLLAVRLLLITLLALLLAEPLWHAGHAAETARVYVMPGVDAGRARAAVAAPLADWYWLAAGEPAFDQPPPTTPDAALSISLIRELDAALPASVRLTVIVPEVLAGLDGERLRLGREVDWRIVAGTGSKLASGLASGPAAEPAPPPWRIAIRADGAAVSVARALLAAWRAAGVALEVDAAAPGVPVAAGTGLLIASGAVDAAVAAQVDGGMALLRGDPEATTGEVVLRDDSGQPLLRQQTPGRGRIGTLAGPLDPLAFPALREPQLPARLLALLRPPPAPPDRALAASVTPLRAEHDAPGRVTPLAPWLIVPIAALALLERLLATRPRREAA